MALRKKIRIGDLLVEHKIISDAQLKQALTEQKFTGNRLGRALIELGFITEDQLLEFLSRQLQIPYIDLKHYSYKPETVRLIPEAISRRYRVVALDENPDNILIGMSDPTDIFAFDELSKILNKSIRQAVVREGELLRTIDSVYRKTEEIRSLAEEYNEELAETNLDISELLQASDVSELPVVKLLQSIFEDAFQVNASDIHIEPDKLVLRLRQRIDGVLNEQELQEKPIAGALVSRLKLMAGLDISECQLPQDDHFNIRIRERLLDVRVSTMPIQYGESVVMHLSEQSAEHLKLADIGMPPELLKRFRHHIGRPRGMVLVSGPAGSGKTTTLYAALNELNSPEKKIITVEDPVEYHLPRINQVQVNSKIHLTFAKVLDTTLRQDPDILLVGEIHDQETAEGVVRTSITGHLVLSSLHTNDAVATVIRLLDMGIPGYILATSLQAIVAQRLIRRICENCTTDYAPSVQERAWLKNMLPDSSDTLQLKHGSGCPHCNNTGYRGRIGVFELLELDEAMADALRRNDAGSFASAAASANFRTITQNGLDYAVAGTTSITEVLRVCSDTTS